MLFRSYRTTRSVRSACFPVTIGSVTKDVDLKFTSTNKALARFSIVTSKKKKDDAGNWVDSGTTFWDITAWDALAESVADHVSKGTSVIVIGTAETQEWVDKTSGEKKSKLGITAQQVAVALKKSRPKAQTKPVSNSGWVRALS